MIRSSDNLENCMFFMHSDGIIEIGVYPVIFGYRVRAGFVGDWSFNLDYCCGDSQEDIEEVYSMVLHVLKNQETVDFEAFPSYKIRPILKDIDCINTLREMSIGMEKIEIPNVSIYKHIVFSLARLSSKNII